MTNARAGIPHSRTHGILVLALLAALLVLPLTLAPRAEAFVYWTNDDYFKTGAIGRANLDGSGVDQNFIVAAGHTVEVAVDGAHIYWLDFDAGTIGRANLDGSDVDESFITDIGYTPSEGLAVDAAHVYWADYHGTIGRADLDGSDVDPNFIAGLGFITSVAVDAAHVYWTNDTSPPPPYTGRIGRANLDGSGVDQNFVTGATYPRDVAVDAGHVYWSSDYLGAIGRANLNGSGVDNSFITAGTYDPGPLGVAVDPGHVYWASYGVIGRANLDDSGDEQSFIPAVGWINGIAVNFSVGKLEKANNKGTAKLTLEVPAPGGIALAQTKKVKGAEVRAEAAGEVTLAIKPTGKARKKLAEHGRAKIKVEVTYTPDGGEPEPQTATLKLVKRG